MTISNPTQTATNYQASAYNGSSQPLQDFKSLSSALQSGDLSSAQAAMTTLQTDLQGAQGNSKTSQLLDPTTAAGKDFQTLQNALQSGDLKGAQDAFTALKQDVRKTHSGHHHHHKVDNDGDTDSSTTNATTNADSTSDTASTTENSSILNVTA